MRCVRARLYLCALGLPALSPKTQRTTWSQCSCGHHLPQAAARALDVQLRTFTELSSRPDAQNMHDSGIWLGAAMVMVGWISIDTYSRVYEPPRARAYVASLRAIHQRSKVRLHCHAYAIQTELGDEFLCLGMRLIPSKGLPDGAASLVGEENAPPHTVDYKYVPFHSGWR